MQRSGASRKRPIEAEADELSSSGRGKVLIDLDELTRLRACETTLVQLSRPIFTVGVVYDMDKADDKERLAAALCVLGESVSILDRKFQYLKTQVRQLLLRRSVSSPTPSRDGERR
jgi:hypothetical protein